MTDVERPTNPVGVFLGVAVAAIAGPAGAFALIVIAFAGVQGLGFGPAESETYAWQGPAFVAVLAAMAMAPTVVFVGVGRTTWPRAFGYTTLAYLGVIAAGMAVVTV